MDLGHDPTALARSQSLVADFRRFQRTAPESGVLGADDRARRNYDDGPVRSTWLGAVTRLEQLCLSCRRAASRQCFDRGHRPLFIGVALGPCPPGLEWL